jgi:Lambda phage tail tape-measure protein (Tape_meas_lam_C)
MPVKAGQIVINLTLGQAQFFQDLVKAKAGVKDFGAAGKAAAQEVEASATRAGIAVREAGAHTVSSMQATSGALRDLTGRWETNTRAVERFLATTLGLGPALQAAFPIAGGIAVGGMIVDLGSKTAKFFKDVSEAPEKLNTAFRDLNAPMRLANDELHASTDRLLNDIAKMSGHQQNALAVFLDDARIAADHLADALDKDLENVSKLTKEYELGSLKAFITEQAPTSGDTAADEAFRKNIAAINEEGQAFVRAAKTKDDARKAAEYWNKQLLGSLDAEIAKEKALAATRERLQRQYEGKLPAVDLRGPTSFGFNYETQDPSISYTDRQPGALLPPDQTLALTKSRQRLEALNQIRDRISEQAANEAAAAADKDAKAGQDRPYVDRMKALAAQLEDVRAKSLAIGQPQWAQELIRAGGEAIKVITELNKVLEHEGKPKLTQAQGGQVTGALLDIQKAQDQDAWKAKFQASTSAIEERIQVSERLAAAIGKGYEATKQANVEARLMQTLGTNYGDAAWMHKPENQANVAALRAGYGREQDAEHGTQVTEATQKLRDQIELERALIAVQAQGAEAVRKAALETKIRQMERAGATKEEIQAERDLADAQRANANATDLAKLNNEIELQRALIAVQDQGAEAVRKATLEEKILQMQRAGATDEQIQKERELADLQRANTNAADLGKIKERIAATERLTGALLGGAEAERRAALENKYAEMQRAGASPEVISEARRGDDLDHLREVSAEALRTVNAYQSQYQKLTEQIEVLQQIQALEKDNVAVGIALRDLENDRLKLLVDETLKLGTARDGLRAFFLEMQESAKNAAEIVKDTLDSALEKTSGNLAKLLTGQKASWSKEFHDLGEQALKGSIKSGLQTGLGQLGKIWAPAGKIAANLGLGKPDGSTEPLALWVRLANASGANGPIGPPHLNPNGPPDDPSDPERGPTQDDNASPWTFDDPGPPILRRRPDLAPLGTDPESGRPTLMKGGSGVFGALAMLMGGFGGLGGGGGGGGEGIPDVSSSIDFGGFLADGGGVDPGKGYWVGDAGEPEWFNPGRSGTVTPLSKMPGGGDTHVYNIDARNADLGASNRIHRALEATHAAAVANGVRANAERSRRTPQRKR